MLFSSWLRHVINFFYLWPVFFVGFQRFQFAIWYVMEMLILLLFLCKYADIIILYIYVEKSTTYPQCNLYFTVKKYQLV